MNYSVLSYETANIAIIEDPAICTCWVDNCFYANKEFLSIQLLCSPIAENILNIISDVLLRLELSINNVRGQCYGGDASMMGHRSGVATGFKAKNIKNIKMLSIYCFGHVLSLSVNDLIKNVKLMKNTLDTAKLIHNVVQNQRKEIPNLIFYGWNLNTHESAHDFCPTGWTVWVVGQMDRGNIWVVF